MKITTEECIKQIVKWHEGQERVDAAMTDPKQWKRVS